MLVQQPVQERVGVGDVVGVVARARGLRERDHPLDAAAQLVEMRDDAGDLAEDAAHAVLERGELLGRELAVQLEVHDRFATALLGVVHAGDVTARVAVEADDRVYDAADADALGADLGADGVHEERQVVGVRLHDGHPGRIAVGWRVGRERAQRAGRRAAPVGVHEGADDLGAERVRVGLDAPGVEAPHVLVGERQDRVRTARRRTRGDRCLQRVPV